MKYKDTGLRKSKTNSVLLSGFFVKYVLKFRKWCA